MRLSTWVGGVAVVTWAIAVIVALGCQKFDIAGEFMAGGAVAYWFLKD